MARACVFPHHDHVNDVIDLDHVRRARRLLLILVDRFGVGHFLESRRLEANRADASAPDTSRRRLPREHRVSRRACDDAVGLARAWIERRSGRAVDDGVIRLMQRDLRRVLLQRIAAGVPSLR